MLDRGERDCKIRTMCIEEDIPQGYGHLGRSRHDHLEELSMRGQSTQNSPDLDRGVSRTCLSKEDQREIPRMDMYVLLTTIRFITTYLEAKKD